MFMKIMDREGMSDSELLEEAFALPWEVDVPASSSCREKEVFSSGVGINQVVRPSAPAKSLIRRGFLGPRAVSPSPVVLKEIMPVLTGKKSTVPVIFPSLSEDKQGVQPPVADVLPLSQVCSSANGTKVSSVSVSQLWYNRRVKEKVAKQLNKNKVLIAEAVGVIPVVGEDRVANALNLAPVLGLS
jgi:hypothetical protein